MNLGKSCGAAVAVLLVTLAGSAEAQVARSQLDGTVTDNTASVLPGAMVTATRVGTGVASTTVTTSAGLYVIPQLPPGVYTVRANLQGFGAAVAQSVTLREGQKLTIDFKLETRTLAEEVTVMAPSFESSTSEIGRYVSNKEFETWPVPVSDGQRQIQSFIFRSLPGAVGDPFFGSINGGQSFSHEILIEGLPLGRNIQGGSNNEMSPPTEMIQEFKLLTGTIAAEYGGGQTAVASFAVKSGTNELHGAGAYYYQDKKLDSNSFVNKSLGRPTPLHTLKNGALALGGPLVIPKVYNGHDRTFFYAGFEFTNEENFNSSGFRSLPTAQFQSGDFSRLLDPAYTGDARSGTVIGVDALGRPVLFGQIYDPRTTRLVNGQVVRDPFAGNIIPREFWDPVARNTIEQDLWDRPEIDRLLNNQRTLDTGSPIFEQKTIALKLDHVISSNHRMSIYANREWRERNNSIGGRYGVPPGKPTNLFQLQRTPSWIVRFSEQWTINSNLLHRFAFGYNRFENLNFSVHINEDWPSKIGLQNVPQTLFPRFAFSGPALFGGIGNYGTTARSANREGSTVFQDDLTWIRGKHSLKAGVEGRFYYSNFDRFDDTGAFTFNQQQTNLPGFDLTTGNAFASFLLGAVQSAGRDVVRFNPQYRAREFSVYLQDDVKVTPKLTLNLGLRWQFIRPVFETSGYMTNADLTKPNPGAGNLPGALAFADAEGRKTFFEPYSKQIQPRLGAAYAVSPRTVLTAGYSMNNTPGSLGFGGPSTFGYNGRINVNRTTRPTQFPQDPVMRLSDRFPDFQGTLPNQDPALANLQGVTAITGDMSKREQFHNFHFTVQQQLPADFTLTATYAGNRGRRLEFDNQINRIPFSALSQYGDALFDNLADRPDLGIPLPYAGFTGTVAQALRPFPQYTGVSLFSNRTGKSRYNAVQLNLERRFSKGLAVLASYTWSRAEVAAFGDDCCSGLAQDGSGLEWRRDGFVDVPHFLKFTWIYELPIGPGKWINVDGVLGKIFGGWTLSGIHNYRSGDALSIGNSSMDGVGYPIRPDIVPNVDPRIDGGGGVDIENGTPYLNPDAFTTQPLSDQGIPSRLGTAPPVLTNVRGPARLSEDLGIMKRVGFGRANALEFRADFINAFNRTGQGNPDTDLASPDFGKIFSVQHAPRRIQLSVRATF